MPSRITYGKVDLEQYAAESLKAIGSKLGINIPIRTEGWYALQKTIEDAQKQISAATGSTVKFDTSNATALATSLAAIVPTLVAGPGTPTISISTNVSVVEGNSGTTPVATGVTVNRNGVTGALVVNLTYAGTATSGSDYVTAPTSVTIADGANSVAFNVQITGDASFEPDETLIVTAILAAYPSVTASRIITILNEDAASTLLTNPKVAALLDSTGAEGQAFNSPTNAHVATSQRWLQNLVRQSSFGETTSWPNYHAGSDQEANSAGGYCDAAVGDSTRPVGTMPGFKSRLPRVLLQTPDVMFVQVTVNNAAASIAASDGVADYTEIATSAFAAGVKKVIYVLMRPGTATTLSSGMAANRVATNNGVVALCTSGSNRYFIDPSVIYTTTSNVASSYNDATPLLNTEIDKIDGYHPTELGGQLETDALLPQLQALGIIDFTFNYARDAIDGGTGTNVSTSAYFTAGTTAPAGGITGNVTGTWLAPINSVSAPTGSNSSLAGSAVDNASTGGKTQRLTITPGGTGNQDMLVRIERFGGAHDMLTYVGPVEWMIEVAITDPGRIVESVQGQMTGSVANYQFGFVSQDGTDLNVTNAGGVPPAIPGGTRVLWLKGYAELDGTNAQGVILGLGISLLPAGATQVATIDIRRSRIRKPTVNPRVLRNLPGRTTVAINGTVTSGAVPIRATLPVGGVRPDVVRYWTRPTSGSNWSRGGEVAVPANVTSVDFNITGLATGDYHVKVQGCRDGGIVAGTGHGQFYSEGVPSGALSFTVPS